MEALREFLLNVLLLSAMSLTSGATIMVLHGLLMHRRLRGGQSISECVKQRAWLMAVAAGLFTLLLLTQAKTWPWEWMGTLTLLVTTAPALLAWLGPPDEHVENCNLCQIGKGSAYNYYFGYLRLMHGTHGIRNRLEDFKKNNTGGLSEDKLRNFYSTALVVLAPTDGEYPSGSYDELDGIGKELCKMAPFKCIVGGNTRSYGGFSVHEVTSSGNDGQKYYVAIQDVGSLATLRKLKQYGPAGFSDIECKKQMKEMIDELEKIVKESSQLRGQLKVVKYEPNEHVGDAIVAVIRE